MVTASQTNQLQYLVAILAVLFGALTIFAGGRVLAGSDPGYVVFQPLLMYNTLMGFVYVVTGLTIWRKIQTGKKAAGIVFGLNTIVLIGIVILYQIGEGVAVDNLKAMAFRTVAWMGFYLITKYVSRTTES